MDHGAVPLYSVRSGLTGGNGLQRRLQKLLNVTKTKKLGWSPKIRLHDDLVGAYSDFLAGAGRSEGLPATAQVNGLRASVPASMLLTDRCRKPLAIQRMPPIDPP